MHHTGLDRCLGPYRFDGVTETGQSVATDDQHIGHAPVLELGDNPEPELGAFVAFAEPEAQNMFLAVDIDGHCDIDGPVHHDVIGADFDNDRIQIQDRIHRVEGPLLPGPQFGQDGVGDF